MSQFELYEVCMKLKSSFWKEFLSRRYCVSADIHIEFVSHIHSSWHRNGPLPHERKKRHCLATIPFQNFPEQSVCLLYNGSNWMPTRSIERWSVQGPASLVKSSLPGFAIGLHRRRAAKNERWVWAAAARCRMRSERVGLAEIIAHRQASRH